MDDRRVVRLVGALGVLLAVMAWGITGAASAGPVAKRGIDAVIEIKEKNGIPKFKGPDTAPQFGEIQVVNKTSPAAIGPHTFSLVKKSKVPTGESERRKCGRQKLDICQDIAAEHEMTFHPTVAGAQVVESGGPGWNASFDGQSPGDSWFTQTQDENEERIATDTGKLFYICIIHPRMQGSIKVVP